MADVNDSPEVDFGEQWEHRLNRKSRLCINKPLNIFQYKIFMPITLQPIKHKSACTI